MTFHLAIETSVEAELTQMGSTNLGSPEARKCQSRCIQIPIPCSNASDLRIPRSSPTTNCFQYSLKSRCLRLLKGMQMRNRSIQSMRGLRGEIMQKLGNTKQILKMSKSKGWLFGCSMVESRSQYYWPLNGMRPNGLPCMRGTFQLGAAGLFHQVFHPPTQADNHDQGVKRMEGVGGVFQSHPRRRAWKICIHRNCSTLPQNINRKDTEVPTHQWTGKIELRTIPSKDHRGKT